MKLNLFVFCSLFASLSVVLHAHGSNSHTHTHNCVHDTDPQIQGFYKEFSEMVEAEFKQRLLEEENGTFSKRQDRILAAETPQPLRVTIDTTALDNTAGGMTEDVKKYLISITNTIQNFLAKFIKVKQYTGNNKFSLGTKCIDVTVPAADISTGVADSDLHLYIIYVNDAAQGYLANAGWCSFFQTTGTTRPNFGRVNFNIGLMKTVPTDLNLYLYNAMVTLHEVIHVLGFSDGSMFYWVDKDTKQFINKAGKDLIVEAKTIRGLSTNLIKTPNIVATARKYYGCDSMVGMQFENQGGSGSIGSHFERTIINTEVMTASASNEGLNLTVFTAAILRDTNYWDEVNDSLTDPIWWGKSKGCDFLEYDCTTSTAYEEFKPSGTQGCSFWGDGYGVAMSETFSDSCNYIKPYQGYQCEDLENAAMAANTNRESFLSDFGYNSHCFTATIANPNQASSYSSMPTRCLQYSCSADQTTITITSSYLSGFTFVCNAADAGVSKAATFNGASIGNITCPTNYAQYCDNQNCKNFCSLQGVCIRGTCYCNPGYSGDDCSLPCSKYSSAGTCVDTCPSGTAAGPDNTCKATCPNGSFPNAGVCSQCDFSCSACTGSAANECTACQFLGYLDSNTCVTTCPSGKWADSTTRQCKVCPVGCADCTSDTVCGTCSEGYEKSGNLCSTSSCKAPCATCGSTATICSSCNSPNFLNSVDSTCGATCPSGTFGNATNRKCEACSNGCSTCSSATSCSVCDTNAGYRLSGSSCTLCAADCATCVTGNVSQCLTCENSKYVQNYACHTTCPTGFYNGPNYQCAACSTGCSVCTNSNACTTCNTAGGYSAYTRSGSAICILSTDCYSPCATCPTAGQPETCGSCQGSLLLSGTTCVSSCSTAQYADAKKVCQSCDTNVCATCSGSATACTTCSGSLNLSKGTCVATCPTGTTASKNVCTTNTKISIFKSSENRLIFSILSAILVLFL